MPSLAVRRGGGGIRDDRGAKTVRLPELGSAVRGDKVFTLGAGNIATAFGTVTKCVFRRS